MSHEWAPATCTAPKTCTKCGETEGNTTAHSWKAATCTAPKTCSKCGATEGDLNPHSWNPATCTNPKVCKNCQATEGFALGHEHGAWNTTSEPIDGKPGKKTQSCNVCDEVIATEDFYYPNFNMSFDNYMKAFNKTYRSYGLEIKQVSTGFSVYLDGRQAFILFNDDRNARKTGVSYAYSTKKLEKFNQLKIRYIADYTSSIDTEFLASVLAFGGYLGEPLVGYDVENFLSSFFEECTVTRNSSTYKECVRISGNYKYVLSAFVESGSLYSSVWYEFEVLTVE